MLVKDLPEDIRIRVKELFDLENHTYETIFEEQPLNNCFIWSDSEEGHNIWENVNNNNYESYYEYHENIKNNDILFLIEELNTKLKENEKT